MEFKKPIYPIEQWNITETEFKKENNYRNETTFALSNGYIGTRGTFEEAYPFDVDTGLEGNFVNGFYESNEIRYGEANFGSPLLSQSLLNLPNLKEIHVILDGEEFTMEQGEVKEYARTLHMKDGILERKLTWTASSGKMTEIHSFRLVSFARKNIMAIRYQVRPVNYAGTVEFVSKMQADVENHTRKTNPIVDYGPFGRRLDPDKVTVEKIKKAIQAAYEEGQSKLKGNGKSVPSLSVLKTPLRDGDLERPDDEAYANSYFINANSATAPGIVDADRNTIIDRSEVYSGVYGRASINLYAFNSNGNKGIACGLNNLQKIKGGEPLGGKSRAEDDFATEDDDDFLS